MVRKETKLLANFVYQILPAQFSMGLQTVFLALNHCSFSVTRTFAMG